VDPLADALEHRGEGLQRSVVASDEQWHLTRLGLGRALPEQARHEPALTDDRSHAAGGRRIDRRGVHHQGVGLEVRRDLVDEFDDVGRHRQAGHHEVDVARRLRDRCRSRRTGFDAASHRRLGAVEHGDVERAVTGEVAGEPAAHAADTDHEDPPDGRWGVARIWHRELLLGARPVPMLSRPAPLSYDGVTAIDRSEPE
jgi:hypothetical protein